MKTPIIDFISEYAEKSCVRLHMPGHKGVGNIEKSDITEISGADSLYEADGIIKESEANAGTLFGADTFYSAEGSSLSIRAMLYLAGKYAAECHRTPLILAGRNAHKTFVSAVSLIGIETEWLTPKENASYLSCEITAEDVLRKIEELKRTPTAVYITSPDYLGNTADIEGISRLCRERGILILVDNAHGAYLKFLNKSRHPIDLGADVCCDSAHKTLPALTGAAYLHISRSAPKFFKENARDALALFGSTSPSYLILSSLDGVNGYIADGYQEKLSAFARRVERLKESLSDIGYTLYGSEPLKITLSTKEYGYLGAEIAAILESGGIVPEFADPDFVVLMLTPENSECDLEKLISVMRSIPKRTPITKKAPKFSLPKRVMTPREAILLSSELLPVSECVGRTLGAVTVGCPPAVPILVSGELIDEDTVRVFEYYGIQKLKVIKTENTR